MLTFCRCIVFEKKFSETKELRSDQQLKVNFVKMVMRIQLYGIPIVFVALLTGIKRSLILHCPAVFGHFSPAPAKTDCAVRIQSINRKIYNESLRLIDWFNPPWEKLPQGDDFRVGSKKWPNTAGRYSICIWILIILYAKELTTKLSIVERTYI